jgi:hypothetical protein
VGALLVVVVPRVRALVFAAARERALLRCSSGHTDFSAAAGDY